MQPFEVNRKTPISEVKLMDCMEGMKQLPDKFFELAIVDPPYGIGESKKKRTGFSVRQKNGGRLRVAENSYVPKEWDRVPSDSYFKELQRVSKGQIVWGANYFEIFGHLPFSTPRRAWWFEFLSNRPKNWIIWDKVNGTNDFNDCELAYINIGCSIKSHVFEYMWNGMMQAKSITEGTLQQGNKQLNEKRIHPTQKPVALYKWLLANYAKEGDKILDTHLGSGSSRIAAYQMGFDFCGYEIDPDYFEAQEKRFKEQTAQQSLFDYKKTG